MSYEQYLQKAPSHRVKRIAEVVREILGNAVSQYCLHQPEMEGALVTITHVDVSPDLKNAKVYVTAHSENFEDEEIAMFLNAHKGQFRTLLAKQIVSKGAPALTFTADQHQREAAYIDDLFNKLD